jgi:hypothetical protein
MAIHHFSFGCAFKKEDTKEDFFFNFINETSGGIEMRWILDGMSRMMMMTMMVVVNGQLMVWGLSLRFKDENLNFLRIQFQRFFKRILKNLKNSENHLKKYEKTV